MESRRIRLGDVIDDYCTRCGLLMNHGVVGMIADEVRKVRCNTCLTEHVYKHARLPKRKRNATAKLFNEVLRGLGREETPIDDAAGDSAAAGSAAAGSAAAGSAPTASAADSAAGSEADSEARSAADSDEPAPPAEPERPPEREGVEAHRRKLYTIRRHSGGKPPVTGKPPGTGTPRR
jgi:hypothetical protein